MSKLNMLPISNKLVSEVGEQVSKSLLGFTLNCVERNVKQGSKGIGNSKLSVSLSVAKKKILKFSPNKMKLLSFTMAPNYPPIVEVPLPSDTSAV